MKNNKTGYTEKGQIILLLLLIMVVALAIGLSIVQRSLVDVSTSTKVEESSRAFSAAEAGIERALRTNPSSTIDVAESELQNSAQASVVPSSMLPRAQEALEYPPLAKEDIAHVWLADPNNNVTNNLPTAAYNGQPVSVYNEATLDIYWGTANTTDKPAIELSIIYFDGTAYQAWKPYGTSPKLFLDSNAARITAGNGFINANTESSATVVSSCSSPLPIATSLGTSRNFYCKTSLRSLPATATSKLMILRARLLYTTTSQPLAVKPTGSASLPPQAKIYTSTGSSGSIQRKIQLFKLDKVVPFYFDFAIFSAGEISK